MVVEDQTKVRRARTVRVLAIPIFCGIFSFCHWFIFFPLMWTYLAKHGMKRFWLFALIVFFMWLLVMALCLSCWWYDKKRQTPIQSRPIVKDATSTLEYRSNGTFDSPSFKTKSSVIQPGYKEKSAAGFDSDKELISMRSIPVQPQNTPSLYNLHTGRHSYDSTDVRNSLLDSTQKVNADQVSKEVLLVKKDNNLKFKTISLSDSEKSSKATLNERQGGYELLLTTENERKPRDNENHTVQAIIEQPIHERDILLRTKYDHCASAQEATKVRLSSDSEDDEELFRHIDMDVRLSDQDISRRNSSGRLFSQSGEIEHLKECNTPDADKLSQNMPEFDDYLHIVSIDTPLSPREVFFSDLIKQANETEQKLLRNKEGGADRRSYCIGDITYNKLNYDHRKSVPLFLYSDQWRKESQTVEDPEQSVDSDDNQELKQVLVEPDDGTSQQIEHVRQTEPKESDVKVVEMSPKKKDGDDLKTVTQMFIIEEKLRYCSSPVVQRPPETENRRDVEPFDDAHKPRFPKDKPLKYSELVSDQVVEPKPKPKPTPKPKPVADMKEVAEPEILKSRAKPGCCDEEPDLRRHRETVTSTDNKRKSSSEYFIAAVDSRGPQSVTSEVFLTVGASGLVSVPEGRPRRPDQPLQKAAPGAPVDLGTWSARGKQDIKRELSQDKLEYKSEDDEVFEDVQSALTKLRRHK